MFAYNTNKRSCGGVCLNEQIHSWLSLRQLAAYLQHDKEKIEGAPLKFPIGYANIMTTFAGQADTRAKEAYPQLGCGGTSILGFVLDRGEHFVMWKQRGETHLFRINDTKLRAEAQKIPDGLVAEHEKQV